MIKTSTQKLTYVERRKNQVEKSLHQCKNSVHPQKQTDHAKSVVWFKKISSSRVWKNPTLQKPVKTLFTAQGKNWMSSCTSKSVDIHTHIFWRQNITWHSDKNEDQPHYNKNSAVKNSGWWSKISNQKAGRQKPGFQKRMISSGPWKRLPLRRSKIQIKNQEGAAKKPG